MNSELENTYMYAGELYIVCVLGVCLEPDILFQAFDVGIFMQHTHACFF